MTKRESRPSDTDIRKLMPDLKTILKHADPEYSDRIHREAMDNPELDAAIAERDRLRAEREAREQEVEAQGGEHAVVGEAPPPRVSAPSPWAKGGEPPPIDRSALPSANVPSVEAAAAPPVTAPVPTRSMEHVRSVPRRPLPRYFFPGVAVLALAPLAMWAAVSRIPPRQPTENRAQAASSAPATASATATAGDALPPQRRDTPPEMSAQPEPPKLPGDAGASAPRPQPSAVPVHRPPIHPAPTAKPIATDTLE